MTDALPTESGRRFDDRIGRAPAAWACDAGWPLQSETGRSLSVLATGHCGSEATVARSESCRSTFQTPVRQQSGTLPTRTDQKASASTCLLPVSQLGCTSGSNGLVNCSHAQQSRLRTRGPPWSVARREFCGAPPDFRVGRPLTKTRHRYGRLDCQIGQHPHSRHVLRTVLF